MLEIDHFFPKMRKIKSWAFYKSTATACDEIVVRQCMLNELSN